MVIRISDQNNLQQTKQKNQINQINQIKVMNDTMQQQQILLKLKKKQKPVYVRPLSEKHITGQLWCTLIFWLVIILIMTFTGGSSQQKAIKNDQNKTNQINSTDQKMDMQNIRVNMTQVIKIIKQITDYNHQLLHHHNQSQKENPPTLVNNQSQNNGKQTSNISNQSLATNKSITNNQEKQTNYSQIDLITQLLVQSLIYSSNSSDNNPKTLFNSNQNPNLSNSNQTNNINQTKNLKQQSSSNQQSATNSTRNADQPDIKIKQKQTIFTWRFYLILVTYILYILDIQSAQKPIIKDFALIKPLYQYHKIYQKMTQDKVYVQFNQRSYKFSIFKQPLIQVLPTVKYTFDPQQCIDQSGQIPQPPKFNKFIIVKYKLQNQYKNKQLDNKVLTNKQKDFQDNNQGPCLSYYSSYFKLTHPYQSVLYTRDGEQSFKKLHYCYNIAMALGLLFIYHPIVEIFFIARYRIKIQKKISF